MPQLAMYPELIYGGISPTFLIENLPRRIHNALDAGDFQDRFLTEILNMYQYHDMAHDLTHLYNILLMMDDVMHKIPTLLETLQVDPLELIVAILYHDIARAEGKDGHELRAKHYFLTKENEYLYLFGADGIGRIAAAIEEHRHDDNFTSNLSRVLRDLDMLESLAQGEDHDNYTFVRTAWRVFVPRFEKLISRFASEDEMEKLAIDLEKEVVEAIKKKYAAVPVIPELHELYDLNEMIPIGYSTIGELLSSGDFKLIYDEFAESLGGTIMNNYLKRDIKLYIYNPETQSDDYRRELLNFSRQIGEENYNSIVEIIESDIFYFDKIIAVQNLLAAIMEEFEA